MKIKFIILLLLANSRSSARCQNTIDSLANAICQTITNDTTSVDSIRLFTGYVNHMNKYVEINPDDNTEDLWSSVFLRLSVKCTEFIKLSIRLNNFNENWRFVSEMPPSSASGKECAKFYKIKKYKYVEPTGDTTILLINKRYWKDFLSDGTYSKLKLTATTDCEFELTFLNSNNYIKNKLSQPGDKYIYRIIDHTDNYFLLCVKIRETDTFTLFKLYYN